MKFATLVQILKDSGIVEQNAPRRELLLTETISVRDGDKELTIVPDDGCKITYAFKLSSPVEVTQLVSLEINKDSFVREIAPARTFCFQYEVEALKAQGLVKVEAAIML